MIVKQNILDFIHQNTNEDIRKLAFRASELLGEDAPFALDQIAGRQIAQSKLPRWASTDDVIFPPHISMEQCSSEQTARYKASVLQRFVGMDAYFMDITGGFGVDFSFMAEGFRSAIYVERQSHLCEIAHHNFPLLGLPEAKIINGDGEEVVRNVCEGRMPELRDGAVFIDPARRDIHGNRTYAIADCTPDILGFIGNLLHKVAVVMVKLSPMLDWHAVVADVNRAAGADAVRELHIVSTSNECKELLVVASLCSQAPLRIVCVNDDNIFSYVAEKELMTDCTPFIFTTETKPSFLFVPNASAMKAGCFTLLEQRFGIKQVAPSSHLFFGDNDAVGFPGKKYSIVGITSMNKKELRHALSGIGHANISTRNFPLSPEQLRQRLKLKDGGNYHIFATTTSKNDRILVVTQT